MSAILRHQGFIVTEAGTVSEALQALPLNADWVLLDLMLPDGSGVRVIEQLKRDRSTSRVCVVSGCHQPVIDEAMRAGADFAFTKPLNVERLVCLLAIDKPGPR